MRIFDFHTHYFPEKVVTKAMARLSAIPGAKAFCDGTLAGLTASMEKASVYASLNLPLATSADSVRGLNAWAAKNNKFPVFCLGSIHPDSEDPFTVAREIRKKGLKGIKLHPEYQNFRISGPRARRIFEACIENELFVLTHAGGDIAFSPPFHSNPDDILEIAADYPELKLVLAHCGSWGMWNDVEKKLAGRVPFFFDLAYTAGFLDKEQLGRIIKKHGAEKILFGSDSPWQPQFKPVEIISALPFNEKEKEAIFYKNAVSLLELH
jgi:hypothetical protein